MGVGGFTVNIRENVIRGFGYGNISDNILLYNTCNMITGFG